MRRFLALACLAATIALLSGNALAYDIRGKVGLTGRLGFLLPADNDSDFYHNKTDAGIIGGGGLIYGIDNHFAAEFDVTRSSFGSETGDFGITNLSFGGQYRFATPRHDLFPYVGLGLDVLLNDYDPYDRTVRNVDNTVGFHVSGGIDYFLQRSLALTAEGKLVAASNVSITDRYGDRRGTFDPASFSSTVGFRYFFQ